MNGSKYYRPIKSATGMFWQIFLWFWLSMLMMVVVVILIFVLSLDKSAFNTKASNALYALPTWPLYRHSASGHDLPRIYHQNSTHPVSRNALYVCPFYVPQKYPWLQPSKALIMLSRHILTVVGVVLMSLLFCFLLTCRIVRPIRVLQQTSHRLSFGDLSARVTSKVERRLDEMGELGRDFNLMAMKLEQLIDSKEQLLQDVSHELRSPLARLQMALALARNASCGSAQREHDRIELEIQRLDTLVGRLISWSRLAIPPKTQRKPIRLNKLLHTLVADTDYEARVRNVQVKLLESTDTQLIGHPDMLHSAVENIIRNAIRFAPEASTIEVSQYLQHQQQQTWAMICIRDYGIGVPKEGMSQLFEPFYRVNDTRGRENNGFGLGLAIAQRMVEHHNGRIQAQNASPGLCVIIHLPITES